MRRTLVGTGSGKVIHKEAKSSIVGMMGKSTNIYTRLTYTCHIITCNTGSVSGSLLWARIHSVHCLQLVLIVYWCAATLACAWVSMSTANPCHPGLHPEDVITELLPWQFLVMSIKITIAIIFMHLYPSLSNFCQIGAKHFTKQSWL